MKNLFFLLIVFVGLNASAQTEAELFKKANLKNEYLTQKELRNQLLKYDFSKLWTQTENSNVYGFIGNDYQRLRIKIISVIKNKALPNTYDVYGKSMVKSNVDEFRGTIKILSIKKFKNTSYGVDDEWKNRGIKGQYMIVGDYSFSESAEKEHSGIFKGTFRTDFYIDKTNKIFYDDIEMNADGYSNNEFVGNWTPHKSGTTKRCNWGDYRIPNSESFDIGAGEFAPNEKYLKYGWQSLRDIGKPGTKGKNAKAVEAAKWWK